MKKRIAVVVTLLLILSMTTVLASSLITEVKGNQDKSIKVAYNGVDREMKDTLGNIVYPVIINGSTYLPVRAIADLVGVDITWEQENRRVNLETGTTPESLPTLNKGTLADPMEIGKPLSWTENLDMEKYKYQGYRGEYTLTVSNSVKLSEVELKNLNFEKPLNVALDYYKVTLDVEIKNVERAAENKVMTRVTPFIPSLKGTCTVNGALLETFYEAGFTGCIINNIHKKYPLGEYLTTTGIKVDLSFSGDIIVPAFKGQVNYLVIDIEYVDPWRSKTQIYFKLEK